jgi:hypothetical protein
MASVLTMFETGVNSSATSRSSQSLVTTTGAAPAFNQTILQDHFKKLSALSVNGAASDYAGNAVLVWTGASQAFGGTYENPNSIRDLLQSVLGSARNISITINSFAAKASSAPGFEDVNASLYLQANSTILGSITGNIVAHYVFVYSDDSWKISQESWNYKTFSQQFSGGMTTFPQWQTVGPPLPQRYSENPFKNWVYFYGGTSAVMLVSGYLASIPILLRLKRKRAVRKVL